MAHFLRDKLVSNLTIGEDSIKQINTTFVNRIIPINSWASEDKTRGKAFLTYIIRFDGKGFRVFSIDELLYYFHQATKVERILFTIETGDSIRSNRQFGTFMELRLDANEPNLCMLTVTSDEGDWVESSFSGVQDTLIKCKNNNGYMRTPWTPLIVQILGVAALFFLSVWAAFKISPRVTIENSFVFSFLFTLLIFSNIWTYLNPIILSSINAVFPNIEFFRPRKDRLHWLIKALISGSALAIVLYILNWLFVLAGEFLKGFVG